MRMSQSQQFLIEVFDVPENAAIQLKIPNSFTSYGIWKDLTEEQFNELYSLAQEGKYGDFFYLAEKMKLKRRYKKINAHHSRKMKEDQEYREEYLRKRREYRRNKNAMDREIQTE